jgi:hypothetical protein
MRANVGNGRARTWRKLGTIVAAAVLALSVFGGTAQGADSRKFSVAFSPPTPASQGGATRFDVTVTSTDNQTIANVVLSLPGVTKNGAANVWPTGVTVSAVFGIPSGVTCTSTATSVRCDLGNYEAFATKTISILAAVSKTVATGNSIVFTASAETNNENGTNNQIVAGTSTPLSVIVFNANSFTTANLIGEVETSGFDVKGSGNLQTKVNLLEDNSGHANTIAIAEGTNKKQPTYCTDLGLVCQSDFVELTVNSGSTVTPYLETVLVGKVPGSYSLATAFVIHLLPDGTVDQGFPIKANNPAATCSGNPGLVPCADFSLANNIVTITVHTATNGKYNY